MENNKIQPVKKLRINLKKTTDNHIIRKSMESDYHVKEIQCRKLQRI